MVIAQPALRPDSITLDGTPQNNSQQCRFRVYFNGEEYWLTMKSFSYLVRLAVARTGSIDGWLSKYDLDDYLTGRYIYRVKQEIPVLIINDTSGHYRLGMQPKHIHFNHLFSFSTQD